MFFSPLQKEMRGKIGGEKLENKFDKMIFFYIIRLVHKKNVYLSLEKNFARMKWREIQSLPRMKLVGKCIQDSRARTYGNVAQ